MPRESIKFTRPERKSNPEILSSITLGLTLGIYSGVLAEIIQGHLSWIIPKVSPMMGTLHCLSPEMQANNGFPPYVLLTPQAFPPAVFQQFLLRLNDEILTVVLPEILFGIPLGISSGILSGTPPEAPAAIPTVTLLWIPSEFHYKFYQHYLYGFVQKFLMRFLQITSAIPPRMTLQIHTMISPGILLRITSHISFETFSGIIPGILPDVTPDIPSEILSKNTSRNYSKGSSHSSSQNSKNSY